jgi:hypothetical protein
MTTVEYDHGYCNVYSVYHNNHNLDIYCIVTIAIQKYN